jgi:CBS domain-containing protein
MAAEELAPETVEDILRLLVGCPAFLGLEEADLAGLAQAAEPVYVPQGADVANEAGDAPLVVLRGALIVRDEQGHSVDLVAAGEFHAAVPGTRCEAIEPALLVLLPATAMDLAWSAPATYLQAAPAPTPAQSAGDPQIVLVRTVMRAGLLTISADAGCREAAERMRDHKVSALVVVGGGAPGIVTDRDLRNRLVAEGRAPHAPVDSITTRPVRTVDAGVPMFEALLEMVTTGVHHLPVTERGRMVGMVSAGDLLRQQRHDPLHLRVSIDRAGSIGALAEMVPERPRVVESLLAAGMKATAIGLVLSAITDRITGRLLDLAVRDLGRPPADYGWLCFGSQARREQTLTTDQDTGLVLPGGLDADGQLYFAQLGRWVTDGLEACGFRRCPGGVMAANDEWRHGVSGWRRRFAQLLTAPTGEHLLGAAIAFDLRTVTGGLAVEPALQPVIADASKQALFLRHLAREVVSHRPPLGFRGRFVVARSGEHAGTFQVKAGALLPIVDLARFHTLARGGTEVSTQDRLAAAGQHRSLSPDMADTLREGYELALGVRLDAQLAELREGREPSDWMDPDRLPPLLRSQLREVFKAIRTAQAALAFQRHTAHLG